MNNEIKYEKAKIKTLLGEKIIIPDYQRKVVWKEAQKRYLIETIFLSFPIPPLFFNIKIDEKGHEYWNLIDGQQRFTSIKDFVNSSEDGSFKMKWSMSTKNKVKSNLEENSNEYIGNLQKLINETDNKYFHELEIKYQNAILNYNILYVEFKENTMTGNLDFDRELFSRINIVSKSLNSQELRMAKYYSSNMLNLNNKVCNDMELNDLLISKRILTKTQIERSLDVELLLLILIIDSNKKLLDTKSSNIDSFTQSLSDIDEEEFDLKVDNIIKDIKDLIEKINFNDKIFGKYYFEIIFYLKYVNNVNFEKINNFIDWITLDENEIQRNEFQPIHTKSLDSKNKSIKIFNNWYEQINK